MAKMSKIREFSWEGWNGWGVCWLVKGGQDFLSVAFLSTNYGRRSSPQKSGLSASVEKD